MSLYEVGEFSRLHISSFENQYELCCSRDVVCFTDGRHVHVMKEREDNLSSSTVIEFDSNVITAGISEDGSFLAVGDSNGVLHFVSVSLELVFHSKSVLESDYQFTTIRFSAIKQGCCKLLVLSSSGLLRIFSNFLIDKLAQGLMSGDMLCIKEVQSVMSIEQTDLQLLHSDTVYSITLSCEDVYLSSGVGSTILSVWYINDNQEIISIDERNGDTFEGVLIIKCCITSDDTILVTLTNTADLIVWLLEVLVIINHLSHRNISQFQLLRCSNSQQDMVACVTQNQTLELLTLPKLTVVYFLPIDNQIILPQGFIHEDAIYFGLIEEDSLGNGLHGDGEVTGTNNIVDHDVCSGELGQLILGHTVSLDQCTYLYSSIKMLIQAQPEDKLSKLLSQHMFVEAFTFAAKYGLNMELVHKKKAEVINSHLCNNEIGQYQLELTNTLNEILDEDFICNLILNSWYPSDGITRDMLLYGKDKIENTEDLRVKICDSLNRLVTYQIIHKGQYSPNTWQAFVEGDLLTEFMSYIQDGIISLASRLWERHEVELISKINNDTFVGIFLSVPEHVSSGDMGTWLKNDILPCILYRFPDTLSQFASWISEWIKRLELTEKPKWPVNALHLLDIVISCLTSNKKWEEQLGIKAEQRMSELKIIISPCVTMLQDLRKQLHNLNFVKEQLGLLIPFFEYLKETDETVIFQLLDRAIAAETIPSIIQTKISPYLQHFSLSLDSILVHYITHMILRISSLSPDSPWEAKGVAVVQAIVDKKLYVEGCIELLRGVRTYWSTLVEGLVQDCLLVNHPCVKELKKEYELLKLKRMLFEYGITDFNYTYSNISIAWIYVNYVLKQNGNTVLEDALKIAELYSLNKSRVYMLHIANLGSNDKLWSIHSVLSLLVTEDAINVAMRTVDFMMIKIDVGFNQEMDLIEVWRANILIGIECLKYLEHLDVNVTNEGEIITELLLIMKKLLSLQENYGIFLTCHTLRNYSVCIKLINNNLSILFTTIPSISLMERGNHFIKFGRLLGYSSVNLHFMIANECIKQSMIQEARQFVSLIDSNLLLTDTEQRLYVDELVNIIVRLWNMFEKKGDDIERVDINWMVSLSAQTVQKCTEDRLLYAIELHSLCCLLKWVWCQCIGDFDAEERFSSVIEINRYKDDGLILELSRVFSVALGYCHMRLGHMTAHSSLKSCDRHVTRQCQVAGPASIDDCKYCDIAQSLIDILEENGHYQLAISIGIHSLIASEFVYYLIQSHDSKATPISLINVELMKELQDTITAKVLTSRKLDHSYGLALLLLAPVPDSKNKITECRRSILSSYTKVKTFCNLAADYGIVTGQIEIVGNSRHYYKTADWGKKLRQYQISFTKAFRGGESEKKAVLLKTFENPSIPFKEIMEFCRHFGFDNEEVYMSYANAILKLWNYGYEDRIADVIKLINNRNLFIKLVFRLLTKWVSPYDYEKIVVLLNLLKANKDIFTSWDIYDRDINDRGLKLLECLKRHIRQAPLSIIEKDWIKKWKDSTKDCVEICNELEETRLPFVPLLFDNPSVAVSILSNELTRESLSKIVPICSILQISPDTVLENSTINIVRDRSKDSETTIKYSDVALLIVCIKCHSKAVRLAEWVAVEIKKNDMKESIVALEGAVEIAEKWKKCSSDEEADVCYRKCKKYLQISQTEQILHECGIKGEEFTTLLPHPSQLISKLYHDLTIARPPVTCVHDVATKIGGVCNLNVRKIRMNLAEEWLPFSKLMNRDMDITQLSMMEDPTAIDKGNNENNEETEEEISLKRLSYLLNLPEEVYENAQYLINWAQTPKILGGVHSRVKALQVLFAISSIEMIESVSDAKITSIINFMQVILFICELEDIHMKTTIEKFQKCKKEGLIRTLWRNHSNEPKAVRLICELCMFYNIHDHVLWNKLLEQLLQLHMIPYLHHILKALSQLPIIHKIPDIKQLWCDTLITPLKEVSVPPTSYQIRECSKSVKLLKQCPFVYDINVTELAALFEAIGMSEQAMACLELLPS